MPPRIPERVATQVRLNKTIYEKVKYISKRETRCTNSQIEHFLKVGVEQYEAEHGEIKL